MLIDDEKNENSQLRLFNSGYIADGISESGKLCYKKRQPIVTELVGSVEEIAKKMFDLDNIYTIDDLKKECDKREIQLECFDTKIYQKLTGLTPRDFNFWANYYIHYYTDDYELECSSIAIKDFNNDYNQFMKYINELISNGSMVSVSAPLKSSAFMHGNGPLSWSRISSDENGHVMTFKYFDQNGDIVVSTYGKDFIIPNASFVQEHTS